MKNNIVSLLNFTLLKILLTNLVILSCMKVFIAVVYFIEILINLLVWLKNLWKNSIKSWICKKQYKIIDVRVNDNSHINGKDKSSAHFLVKKKKSPIMFCNFIIQILYFKNLYNLITKIPKNNKKIYEL